MFKTVKLQNSEIDQTIGKDSGTLCTLSVALSKSLFGKVGVVIFSSVGLMYSIGRRKQTCLAHWHSLILSFLLSLPFSFSLLSLSLSLSLLLTSYSLFRPCSSIINYHQYIHKYISIL